MADKEPKHSDAEAKEKEVLIKPSNTAPLIFISHDTKDAELAEAFTKL